MDAPAGPRPSRRPVVRLDRICTALLVLALSPALVPSVRARDRKSAISLDEVPPWIREAAQSPAAASDTDLVWLLEDTTVEPLASGGVRVAHRLAAKVVTAKGLEALDTHTLLYRKGDTVSTLGAWTLQPDGTARAADAKLDVTDGPAVPFEDVFADSRARTVRAPAAMLGSVVAFEDEITETLDLGAYPVVFGDPARTTLLSRFTLKVPEGWGRQAVLLRAEGFDKQEAPGSITVTARSLAPLTREDDRPPDDDLLPVVWMRWWSPDGARGFKDWDAVGRWYDSLSAPVLSDLSEAGEIAARLKPAGPEGLPDAFGRAFAFAARDVRYVSIQIGIGGFKPHPPGDVCANRYGDCKDKAFLMRAFAGGWGLKTYPVLVRTRDMGRVAPDVPTPGQFNHCIAAVVLPDGVGVDAPSVLTVAGVGRIALIDATVREGNAWSLPRAIQGTRALLVQPSGGALVTLPVQPPGAASTRRVLTASLDDTGKMLEGSLVETFGGSAATFVRGFYAGKSHEERKRDILSDLQDRFAGTTVVDYAIDGLDRPEASIVETTRITAGRFGKRVGELLILEPGREGYGVVSAALAPPPRRWPLDVGGPREEIVEVTLSVPPGWTPEELPAPMDVETPEITAHAQWRLEDDRLAYRRTARLLVSEVPPDRYAAFRTTVRRVAGEDGRAIVFVKEH